jgi:hypothetical protein
MDHVSACYSLIISYPADIRQVAALKPSMSSPSTSPPPIVTVTILSPSATSQVQQINGNGNVKIPVASIVGGCLAGIILAVAAVVGWHLWGRNIKRKEKARRKEAVGSPPNSFIPIPSHCPPLDRTSYYAKKYETQRVRLSSFLLHSLQNTYPRPQGKVCHADIE